MSADVDPALCPLCGRSNRCAIVAGKTCAECWCAAATIDAGQLQRVAPAARDRACLCADCAGRGDAQTHRRAPGQ